MTLSERSLARLFGTASRAAIREAVRQARATKVLAGAVEDLNDELDLVMVRMDNEAIGSNPAVSDNYGAPGIVYATRLGTTFVGEQVRVTFDGPAGASAMQTSVENRFVLPFGKTAGQRIEMDGEEGVIMLVDEDDEVVGFISPERWFAGKDGQSHVQFDPFGGLRLYSGAGLLTIVMEPSGKIFVRDPADTGLNFIEISTEGIKILDPVVGQDIVISTAAAGSISSARYYGSSTASPGATIETPAGAAHNGNDLEIRHAATWFAGSAGTPSWTQPAGYTKQLDTFDSGSNTVMSICVATRQPAVPDAVRTFTSALSGWQFDTGHTIVVRGTGSETPTYRSLSESFDTFTTQQGTYQISLGPPTGLQAGDKMVAFVAFGQTGGNVPTGWATPEGWRFLGAKFSSTGTNTLATGVWEKDATADDVAMVGVSEYLVDVTAPGAGTKKFHGCIVAVATPGQVGGGADIKVGGQSLSRGVIASQIETDNDNHTLTGSGGEANTDLVLTPSVIAGRMYKVGFYTEIHWASAGATTQGLTIKFTVDGVDYARVFRRAVFDGPDVLTASATIPWIPSATGTPTVRMRLRNEAGATKDVNLLGSSTLPRFFWVEDAGLAPA
jgi:hypothetical protein